MNEEKALIGLDSTDAYEQVQSLSWIEEHGAGPALLARATLLSASPEMNVRSQLARTIAKRGSLDRDASVRALGILLRDVDQLVRVEAAEACLVLGAKELKSELIGLVRGDPNVTVRAAACEALGAWPDDDSVQALALALADEEEVVRSWAVMGLGDTKRSDALEVLRRHIDVEASASVLLTIYLELLSVGDRNAIGELKSIAYQLSVRDLHVLFPKLHALTDKVDSPELIRDIRELAAFFLEDLEFILTTGAWARQEPKS